MAVTNLIAKNPRTVDITDDALVPSSPGVLMDDVSDIEPSNESNVKMLPDGGALVSLGDSDSPMHEMQEVGFNGNLAELVPEGELTKLATDLIWAYEADKRSRSDWEKAYKKGLPLLGFQIEERTEPWPNACGVFHPVMSEAAIRFVASAMTESFPARGPVKTVIVGKWTRDKEKKAHRVQEEMNYQLTEVMKEYRAETEQAIWRMSIAGSAFKKIYFDPILNRPTAMCVYPEHLIVPYGVSNLDTCERFTHELYYTDNQIEALQASGFYRAVDISRAPIVQNTEISDAKDKISGQSAAVEIDTRHEILEIYADLSIPGIDDGGLPCPYIVTIEKSSMTVLSIYRNWDEQDQLKKKKMCFVHYQYMPGFGFYGLGLIHILGGLTKAATSITRQLIDAGTISNLRAGYKSRGLRIKGDNRPLQPGELRDVDVLSGVLRDNIYFPDMKGPSPELAQLLGNVVDEARKIGSVADMKVSEISGEMPVGTILAIFERNMKVQSAIQARLHASLKEEFKILADLISKHSARYDYEIDGDPAIKQQDFDPGIIGIVPVSDPNATTMSQRVIQHQAVMQMAKDAPNIYDIPELHRRALDIMGMKDVEKIIPDTGNVPPLDPVSENMNILNGKPVKVGMEQDHESHIKIHMAAATDPSILSLMQMNPNAQSIASAMSAHVQEHLAFAYRARIEKAMGVPLPPPGQPLPPEVEANYSRAVAQAAEQVLEEGKNSEAQKKAEEAAKDPVVLLQEKELALKDKEIERKKTKDMLDDAFRKQNTQIKSLLELSRQASSERSFKAQVEADSVQAEGERALQAHKELFNDRQEQHRNATKLMDRRMQEITKERISKNNLKNSLPDGKSK